MNGTFTPGPWSLRPDEAEDGEPLLMLMADVWGSGHLCDIASIPQVMACDAANARLMGAAPDLYAVLEAQIALNTAVTTCAACESDMCPPHLEQRRQWFLARDAAMAKARGETP
jgi:hypothetical protein